MKKTLCILVTILVLSSITLSSSYYIIYNSEKCEDNEGENIAILPHFTCSLRDYIVISNNSEFTSANGVSKGSGTKENPFIIKNHILHQENLEISTIHDYYGILIQNTTAHFIIQECFITNFDKKTPYPAGIKLINVSNGKIENVILTGNGQAISLENCSNFILKSNEIQENGLGITVRYSTNITIQENKLQNHQNAHIQISNSQQISINMNECLNSYTSSIESLESTNVDISNNMISNSYIGIEINRSHLDLNETKMIIDIFNNTISYTYFGMTIDSNLKELNLANNTINWSRIAIKGHIMTSSEKSSNILKNEFDDEILGNLKFIRNISIISSILCLSLIIVKLIKQKLDQKRHLRNYMKYDVQENELVQEHDILLKGLKDLNNNELHEE